MLNTDYESRSRIQAHRTAGASWVFRRYAFQLAKQIPKPAVHAIPSPGVHLVNLKGVRSVAFEKSGCPDDLNDEVLG